LSEGLPAGNFSDWLRAFRAALSGGPGMNVACGDCVGCCTSSYYIKVRPHEHRALARIGAQHLLPSQDGSENKHMGFDAHGHCPMFANGGCSIYTDRPETCRLYDCRVFAAAGLSAGEEKSTINERIGRWRFDYPGEADRAEQRAVSAAAAFIGQHPIRFPNGRIPSRPSEVAVLAIKCYPVFMDDSRTDAERRAAIIDASRAFDLGAAKRNT